MNQVPGCRQVRDEVMSGRTTCAHVAKNAIDIIRTVDESLGCYHEVFDTEVLETAEALDRQVADGKDPGPLCGVPIAIKDNIATRSGRTTCSSRMLQEYRSPYDATVIRRLKDAGALLVGKTNCDEFAIGSSTEHCAWGPTRNPWDTDRVPGGSSGGSAAAVAAGTCSGALGSDTGGSIRQPASFCGCVGLKPTYGRVSRFGLVAFGSSLDQVGPFARNTEDAAMLLEVISGYDPNDSTSADVVVDPFSENLDRPIENLRIGVPVQMMSDRNDPGVNARIEEAIDVYRSMGATITSVDLPLTDYGISTYYVIAPAEASSNLARYDGIRYGHRCTQQPGETLEDLYSRSRSEGFGDEVQRRIMLGTYVLSSGYYDAYYKRALQVRRLIKEEFDRAFNECDILLGPTSPMPAFGIGDDMDPLQMYLCDVYTVNTNISGHCGISLQAGFTDSGNGLLPVGLHLQAPPFQEHRLLRAARMFESATAHHEAVPENSPG